MARFKPRELREGLALDELRRELNAIQKDIRADLDAAANVSPVTSLQTTDYTAKYGDVVRVAPPSGGLRLILPPVNLAQPNGFVTVVVETATGALTAEAVDTTVNGATTLVLLAGVGTVEFRLTPTGWYAWSASLQSIPLTSLAPQATDTMVANVTAGTAAPTAVGLSTLAGAGLAFAAHTLDVTGSTSITVTGDQVQRAALTGFAEATANSNATTSAEPLVTYAASANMSAERVATNSTSVTVSIATANQIDFQRAALTGDVTAPLNSNATTLADGVVTPLKLAPTTSGIGVVFAIRTGFSAAAAGAADDVTIYNAAAPLAFRILDVLVLVSTAIGGSSVRLRDTSGGGGSALSSAISTAATGTARNSDTATQTVALNGSVFLRRSDRGVAGEVVIIARPA